MSTPSMLFRLPALSVLAVSFFFVACATAPEPAPPPTVEAAAQPGAAVSPDAPAPVDPAATAPQSGVTAWSNVDPGDVRISAERVTDALENQRVRIIGYTGILNGTTAFTIGSRPIRGLLNAFLEAGFETLPERSRAGKRLARMASLQAGTFSREVSETFESPSDPRIATLVDRIFDVVAPIAADRGTSVSTLTEGLDRIGNGTLSPLTLDVILNVRGEAGTEGDYFLLVIREGEVRLVKYDGGAVASDERRTVDPDDLQQLARLIGAAQPETLSPNLWSNRHIEVDLEVLGHSKEVIARSFAQMAPHAKPDEQTRLREIVSRLESMKRTWFGK